MCSGVSGSSESLDSWRTPSFRATGSQGFARNQVRWQDGRLQDRPYTTYSVAPWLFATTQGRSRYHWSLYILQETEAQKA